MNLLGRTTGRWDYCITGNVIQVAMDARLIAGGVTLMMVLTVVDTAPTIYINLASGSAHGFTRIPTPPCVTAVSSAHTRVGLVAAPFITLGQSAFNPICTVSGK